MTSTNIAKRNFSYDLMRIIGIASIMIAHASPPFWLFQVRNFGTPLLIVASGLTYSTIYAHRDLDLWPFYRRRLSRLILPAWIFLATFFLFFYGLSSATSHPFPFSAKKIVESFVFADGIGFVWILKIYIILALATPWALKISRSIQSDGTFHSILILGYAAYEIILTVFPDYSHFPAIVRTGIKVLSAAIPYLLIYLYGFRVSNLSDRTLKTITISSLAIFVGMAWAKAVATGGFVDTQTAKYPPRLYYLIYAFFCLNAIFYFIRSTKEFSPQLSRVISWLSSNSLWIYLWHIFAYFLWDFFVDIPYSFSIFLAKTAFLISFGCIMTIAQRWLFLRLLKDRQGQGAFFRSLLT